MSDGPLDGLRVIELGSVVAGPFAGRLLADYGAKVIKVESPTRPDPMREWGQAAYRGHRLWWPLHARNKHCVTLDLHDDADRVILLDLIETADVVIENFRPGTLEGWGLGYGDMTARNPGVVLARISGYGQTGPSRAKAGYASVAEAVGGLRYINGYPGQAPPRIAISLGDSLAGMFAVIGILAALRERDRTGQGQEVDVALSESCLALTESMIPEFEKLGRVRQPSGTRLEGIAPSNAYRSADEEWLIVAANQDNVFRRLCAAMHAPELADDPRFFDHVARGENQDALDELVGAWVASRSAHEVLAILEPAGVVAGRIYTAADILTDEQFQTRDMLAPHFDRRIDEWILGPGVVPRFSRTPGRVRWAGPAEPGADNDEVFTEAERLRRSGSSREAASQGR